MTAGGHAPAGTPEDPEAAQRGMWHLMGFKWNSERMESVNVGRASAAGRAWTRLRDCARTSEEREAFLALTHRRPVRDVAVLVAGVEGNVFRGVHSE